MGVHLDTNLLYAIDRLPVDHKLELITYLSGKVKEDITNKTEIQEVGGMKWRIARNPSGAPAWYDGIKQAKDLTKEERLEALDRVSGAWKDSTPDDLAEQIMSSRTISTREINLDD